MKKEDFILKIQGIDKSIPSKSKKASYTDFVLEGDSLSFTRVNTGKRWNLSVDKLYNVYKQHSYINTSVVKKSTGGKVNSPSVAVLIAIGCIDCDGNRIEG